MQRSGLTLPPCSGAQLAHARPDARPLHDGAPALLRAPVARAALPASLEHYRLLLPAAKLSLARQGVNCCVRVGVCCLSPSLANRPESAELLTSKTKTAVSKDLSRLSL